MVEVSNLTLQNLLMNKLLSLKEMLEFTKEQSRAIKQEEIEAFDSLIDKKEDLIKKIDQIDSEFEQTKEINNIDDKNITEIKLQIKKVLKEIKTIDDENNRNLVIVIADMKLNIKDVRQGQRAMKNYDNSDPYKSFASLGGTLFIDQDS